MRIVQLREPHYLRNAAARHPQELSAPPTRPWVGVQRNGKVICAHSYLPWKKHESEKEHIVYFLPCSCLPTTLESILYAKLCDIDFETPQLKKKRESLQV